VRKDILAAVVCQSRRKILTAFLIRNKVRKLLLRPATDFESHLTFAVKALRIVARRRVYPSSPYAAQVLRPLLICSMICLRDELIVLTIQGH
jgi:hypothetical protein